MIKQGDMVTVCESNLAEGMHRPDWYGKVLHITTIAMSNPVAGQPDLQRPVTATIEDWTDHSKKRYDRLLSRIRRK